MLYTGLPISAEEALKAGLVSRVVKADQLGWYTIFAVCFFLLFNSYVTNRLIEMVVETETQKVIESIRQKSLPVIRLGKQFLQRQIKMDNIMEAYK